MKKSIFLKVVVLSLFFVTLSSFKDCNPPRPDTRVYAEISSLTTTTECLDAMGSPVSAFSPGYFIAAGGVLSTGSNTKVTIDYLDWICNTGTQISFTSADLVLSPPDNVAENVDISRNFTVSIVGMNHKDEKYNNISVFRFDANELMALEQGDKGKYYITRNQIILDEDYGLEKFERLEARIYYY